MRLPADLTRMLHSSSSGGSADLMHLDCRPEKMTSPGFAYQQSGLVPSGHHSPDAVRACP